MIKMAFLAIDGKRCRMMESARQELQGRREYMSNDKIKSWPSRSNGHRGSCSFVDHSWFHLFTLVFTWDSNNNININTYSTYIHKYYQPTSTTKCSATQHGIMTALRLFDLYESPDQCESRKGLGRNAM